MEFVIFNKEKNRIPIKCWLGDIESGAREQAENLSNLPFAYKHIALMPDCHQGYGMPIGGVLVTKDVIIPNAVGVDIGCGMRAMKTNVTQMNASLLKEIMSDVREVIPVGTEHNLTVDFNALPRLDISLLQVNVMPDEIQIEFQVDDENVFWVMLHSGSRNLGYKVAQYYNKLAKAMNMKWESKVPAYYDLAFLPVDSKEGHNYLCEMDYCVEFAKANRKLMMDRIRTILRAHNLGAFLEDDIDIKHNYVRLENHFGKNVWVHRKGAISAKRGEVGIVPGSQGTASYIVEGLGNEESFTSCSHGAGRRMSRSKAKENLNLEDEQAMLNMQGIIHSVRSVRQLDEAPSAYKDIDKVMELQKDLCKITKKLTPMGVIKG